MQSLTETIQMVNEAFGTDKIYHANPNLVLSIDNTTISVFEGTSEGSGDWEWKITDKMNSNQSVCSDFEVGDDAENKGGLRDCPIFTFTTSELSAPPYISGSGLTPEELSIEDCPGGILASKVPNLCKGGDDIFNDGYGWLIFLRGDRKG